MQHFFLIGIFFFIEAKTHVVLFSSVLIIPVQTPQQPSRPALRATEPNISLARSTLVLILSSHPLEACCNFSLLCVIMIAPLAVAHNAIMRWQKQRFQPVGGVRKKAKIMLRLNLKLEKTLSVLRWVPIGVQGRNNLWFQWIIYQLLAEVTKT